MNTVKITTQALEVILFGSLGTIAYKQKATEIKLRKRDQGALNELGITRLFKQAKNFRMGKIGGRYEDAVRSEQALEAMVEGTELDSTEIFNSLPPKGKTFLQGSTTLMENIAKDTKYLAVRVMGKSSYYYFDQDGREWAKEAIEFALPPVSKSSRQPQEKKVIWNTPKLENITNVVLDDGRHYEVV